MTVCHSVIWNSTAYYSEYQIISTPSLLLPHVTYLLAYLLTYLLPVDVWLVV